MLRREEITILKGAKRILAAPIVHGMATFRNLSLEIVNAYLLDKDLSQIGITEPVYELDWTAPAPVHTIKPEEATKEVTFKGSLTGPGRISIPIEILDWEYFLTHKKASWKPYTTLKTRTNILGAYEVEHKFTDLKIESLYRLYATTFLGRPATDKIVLGIIFGGWV